MRILRRISTLAVTLLLITSTTAVAEKQFRVCADPLHPPYSSKKGDGFENEIAELFAKQLGQTVSYMWFPQRIGFIRNTLKAKLPDSEQYKCDVIMGVPAGYDLTLTTKPYYHSTYVMLITKGRGWDDIKTAEQLASLDDDKLEKIRMAMFDRGPGTTWLHQNDLTDRGIPYQSMTGDDKNNVAMMIDKDLRAGKIDMVILWGPMAGYVLSKAPAGSYISIPMQSGPGMKFDFSIAMGVRYGDKTRKEQLNKLIDENNAEIKAILSRYQVPLLPIPKQTRRDDDD